MPEKMKAGFDYLVKNLITFYSRISLLELLVSNLTMKKHSCLQ